MKTKTLTQIHKNAIFRDQSDSPWICASALRKQIAVPTDCRKIRLCLTKDEPDNDGWYEIQESYDTPLRGIRQMLTLNLKMWLYEGRTEGYHYFYIDYAVEPARSRS